MVTESSTAVIEPPSVVTWELLELLASQETPREDTSSAFKGQQAATSRQETNPSVESVCERVGYRIGRFLGDVVQTRQQFRSMTKAPSPGPVRAARTSSAILVNTPTTLLRRLPTSVCAPVTLGESPMMYHVSVSIAQVLRQTKTITDELLADLKVAIKEVLQSRVARVALACIIGPVAAEIVLGGFGVFSLVAHGGIPSLADVVKQAIDLSSSIGEAALGFMLSPHVAEIAITALVIAALIVYRRWEVKGRRAATEQTS